MKEINILEIRQFINDLELAEPRLITAPVLEIMADPNPSGYVDDGMLVSFVANIDPMSQSDVLNSFLLAQLAANKTYDREQDTQNWYRYYRNVLENIGWVIQGFSFTKFNASGGAFSVDKAVIDVLAAIATGSDAIIIQKTLNALKNLSANDGRVVLFERESHNLHNGNFQVAIANQTGGVVALSFGAFEFKASQDITRILFWSYETASTELFYSSQRMSLNGDIYGQVRQDIIIKLGENARNFVKKLPDLG